MKKAVKSKNRVDLINSIVDAMANHSSLQKGVKRKNDESAIQQAVFSHLEKEKLVDFVSKSLNMKKSKAEEIVHKKFKYEHKATNSVNRFRAFEVHHRPDAILNTGNCRIAFEVKKGDSGDAIRSGIGQSMLYSLNFDFVIYFFVDMTSNRSIKRSINGGREEALVKDLWKNRNIVFKVA